MILDDKVAVISGIGPGLGQELAYVFAREGAHVVLAARTESKLDEVAATIATRSPSCRTLVCPTDLAQPAQTQRLVDATVEHFGRIDCLVNNAFLAPPFVLFEDADLADWRHPFEATVFGSLRLTQQALVPMKRAGRGSVVFVNSMIQKKPLPTQAGYAATKGALTAAARVLAKEYGPFGIRVNSTYMGWMWGPPVEGYVDAATAAGRDRDEVIAEITAAIPLGAIPDDAECANSIAFLASDLASVVTGADLNVNGGEFMV
jgi:NAD(P)-dependent dehydrogenase (short-subunit alcohol dehydrogenase family)